MTTNKSYFRKKKRLKSRIRNFSYKKNKKKIIKHEFSRKKKDTYRRLKMASIDIEKKTSISPQKEGERGQKHTLCISCFKEADRARNHEQEP